MIARENDYQLIEKESNLRASPFPSPFRHTVVNGTTSYRIAGLKSGHTWRNYERYEVSSGEFINRNDPGELIQFKPDPKKCCCN
jgi:hypothetical protein